MRSNITIAVGLLLLIALMVATLGSGKRQLDEQKVSEQGIVTEVYSAGIEDAVLKLKGQSKKFYLDNALNQGLTLRELKDKILNQFIEIEYRDHLTFEKEKHSTKYISKLKYHDEVLFELDEK